MTATARALKAPARRRGTRNDLRRRILRSRLPKSARLIGLVLAEQMDRGEHYVITNNQKLAKATGLCERTVRTYTGELVRRRYLRRTRPDGRFAWRYEPIATRVANAAPREVVVAIRGATVAPQAAAVATETSGLGSRFRSHEDQKLSPTVRSKAKTAGEISTADEYVAHVRSKLGRRTSSTSAPARESQLEKQLALRDRARGGRK